MCEIQFGFQQAQNEDSSLPQEIHGSWLSLGLPSDQERKSCLWLLRSPRSRPDRLQANGKAISCHLLQTVVGQQRNSESKKGGSGRNLC